MAEAASELRRQVLDRLRENDLPRAEYLLGTMDDIYSALVTVDFPDAITGGLRRTTDALRAVLERTRGDVTMAATQGRVERALREALGSEIGLGMASAARRRGGTVPGGMKQRHSPRLGGEGKHGRRGEDLSRPQDGRGEVRLVRGVGEVLRLQRHAVPLPVRASAGADESAVEIAAAVELDSRLGRPDGQGAATAGIAQDGGFDQGGVAGFAVEHDVVVVAAADEQLRMALTDARPDRRRGREIEGGVR